MDVYDFLNLFNDLTGAVVRLYDMTAGRAIYESRPLDDPVDELCDIELNDLEVLSVDLYRDGQRIVLELNVETDPDDEGAE